MRPWSPLTVFHAHACGIPYRKACRFGIITQKQFSHRHRVFDGFPRAPRHSRPPNPPWPHQQSLYQPPSHRSSRWHVEVKKLRNSLGMAVISLDLSATSVTNTRRLALAQALMCGFRSIMVKRTSAGFCREKLDVATSQVAEGFTPGHETLAQFVGVQA